MIFSKTVAEHEDNYQTKVDTATQNQEQAEIFEEHHNAFDLSQHVQDYFSKLTEKLHKSYRVIENNKIAKVLRHRYTA